MFPKLGILTIIAIAILAAAAALLNALGIIDVSWWVIAVPVVALFGLVLADLLFDGRA